MELYSHNDQDAQEICGALNSTDLELTDKN